MTSLPAKEVAREVLETVRKGKKPNLGKIIKSKGYALTTSTVPTQVTNTKSYQEEIFPVVHAMEVERNRIIDALSKKKLSKEKYRDMIDGLDKLTKNIQLLSGKKTSNEGIEISGVEISIRK
jgi:hypothetical protein